MDRSSGYLLGNINATPASASLRRARDSSVGAMGRANLDTTSTTRYRDSSLNRGGRLGAALHRHEMKDEEKPVNQRKRQPNTAIEKPIEKAAKQESAVKSWRERREAAK